MSTPDFVPTTCVDGNASMEPAAGNTPAGMPETMQGGWPSPPAGAERVTLGNLPPLQLGRVLQPLSPGDDLLEEMLEDRQVLPSDKVALREG